MSGWVMTRRGVVTLTRRRLHSVHAIEARLSFPSSALCVDGPSGTEVRGRIGRYGFDGSA